MKFNDPAYMIRSVKCMIERVLQRFAKIGVLCFISLIYVIMSLKNSANAADSVYCIILAQNAVHGAMAGMITDINIQL